MAATAGTVRVKGLRELQQDFRKMEGSLRKEVREGLREAAEPVRKQAQALFEPINADSAAGYRVRVRARGVAVEQSRRRTTGRRPDYGRRQMGRALIPALNARQGEVISSLDKMLGRLAGENGF
jgi:hypothetical protein